MTTEITTWLEQFSGITPEVWNNLLATAVVLFLLWLLRRGLTLLVRRQVEDQRARYTWQKIIGYFTLALLILFIGQIWLEGFQDIATYLGLLSAGLAVAMRDIILDFFGWLYILLGHTFKVGDRIQIGNNSGDVIDQRILSFSLLEIGNWAGGDQSTGRVIQVPNGKVFTDTIANYEAGFYHIWNEIPVTVTFESNWQTAKQILRRIIDSHAEAFSHLAEERMKKASQHFLIHYSTLTPIVYTSVTERGVLLTIRYLCEPRQRRTSAEIVWEEILTEFAACPDITLLKI